MSDPKYKVKMKGKETTPLGIDDIRKLIEKKVLTGKEQCREVSSREWGPLSAILEDDHLDEDDQLGDHTLFRKIEDIKRDIEEAKDEELKFLDEDLLKKNVEFRTAQQGDGTKDTEEDREEEDFSQTKINVPKDMITVDKTLVRPLSRFEKEELERLREERKKIDQEKEASKKETAEDEEKEEEPPENLPDTTKEKKEISFDEQTIVASLKGVKEKIISEVKESETALEKSKNKTAEKEKASLEEEVKLLPSGAPPSPKENQDKKKSKRRLLVIAIFAITSILFLSDITPDKKKEAPQIIPPKINFPPKMKFKEAEKSKEMELQGDKVYRLGGYLNTVKASRLYAKSLGYDFDNRTVFGKLILNYAELYPNSMNTHKDSEVLMKLIKIAERKIPNDINYATGTAMLFYQIKRPLSAINVIERFLKINKTPSTKLIRYYMLSLLSAGLENEAQKAFKRLQSLPEKNIESYLGLVEYYMAHEKFDHAALLFAEAIKKYPNHIGLLIEYCRVLLQQKNSSQLEKTLLKTKELGFENSPYFYSHYLKYMGIIGAMENKPDIALQFFKKSLKIFDSADLRKKLEALELSNASTQGKLSIFINENKTVRLVLVSQKALVTKNFNKALSYAIKAVDLNSDYYPAVKQLAKVQRMKGHFQSAIDLLKKYIERNNFSIQAQFDLIEVYIHSYRLTEAESLLSQIVKITPDQERRYKYILGKFYLFSRNYTSAINELQEAIDRDPLNDEIFSILANLYSENGKFKEAKSLIIRAIELNPGIISYRSLYGHILYEQNGADVAIGYTRKLLQDFKDHPRLLGDIAKYYYKSGQQKEFDEQLQKIKSLPKQSADLYRSLFDNALLEGNAEEMIKYGKELTRWSPGDLAVNLEFGEKLIEIKKYDDAFQVLSNTLDRLATFPRLHYLIGKNILGQGRC